jgi:hypothetical protein
MGGSEAKCREVNPLRIKARMSTANRNAVDGASPILRRRERINDSTDSNESASRSSQIGLGNVSHSRVNDERHVRCKGRKCDDGSRQENSPERAGLQKIDLKRRVRSKVVCWKSCDVLRLVNSSKSKSVITEDVCGRCK